MKKIAFIIFISCLSILTAFAQAHDKEGHRHQKPTPEMRKKIEAYKVAFFTRELDLTPEEAQVFWPIFNEHEDKFKALKKEYKPTKRPDLEGASDTEIQEMIDKYFEFKQKELDLEKEYASKFAEVLPLRKVIMLNHLERKFRHKIIRQLKKRKE